MDRKEDEHRHSEWKNDHGHLAEDWVVVGGKRYKPTAHRHTDDSIEFIPSHLMETEGSPNE